MPNEDDHKRMMNAYTKALEKAHDRSLSSIIANLVEERAFESKCPNEGSPCHCTGICKK